MLLLRLSYKRHHGFHLASLRSLTSGESQLPRHEDYQADLQTAHAARN